MTPSTSASSSRASRTGAIVNLYGRSSGAAFAHRFLPGSKGGLFAWESVSQHSGVILVEGLFDLAVLWQAGFSNTTCALGTHLTPAQLGQLSGQLGRRVYILFDQDENQAGQHASQSLALQLQQAGLTVATVSLPMDRIPTVTSSRVPRLRILPSSSRKQNRDETLCGL